MFLGKKNLIFLLFGWSFVCMTALGKDIYWREFQALKKNPSYAMIFDSDMSPLAQVGAREIENIKKVDQWSRLVRPVIGMAGAIIVDKNTMPALYAYVDTLCKSTRIETPIVAVIAHKGIFNAFASKILENSGTIVLSHDLLKECPDEEVEGVIAHEIGHIKYNHINKCLALNCVRLLALSQLYRYSVLTGFKCFLAYVFAPYLLVGKKFEWEADNFACKDALKAKGLIHFFERVQYKEEKLDHDLDKLEAVIAQTAPTVKPEAQVEMWTTYRVLQKFNSMIKSLVWLYHETPLGAHPRTALRIENAKRIMKEQERAYRYA